MASTLKDNLENIRRYQGIVFTDEFVEQIQNFVDPIKDSLCCLDNKDRQTNKLPDADDVLDVLKAINDRQETEDLFVDAFNVTGPILMMAIRVLVVNCLLHNRDAFANQLVHAPATEKCKADPSSQTMMQYLIDSTLMRRRTVQRTRNIWDSNLYVQPEADQAPQQRQSRSRRRLDHTDEDQSDASAGPPETTSRRCPTSSLGATPNSASCFRRVTSTPASSGRRSWSQSSRLSDISSIHCVN